MWRQSTTRSYSYPREATQTLVTNHYLGAGDPGLSSCLIYYILTIEYDMKILTVEHRPIHCQWSNNINFQFFLLLID